MATGVATALAALPQGALAHSPMPGIEGFYRGVLHPVTTPDQALAILAMGVLLGGFALPRLVPAFVGLALGLALGIGAGLGLGLGLGPSGGGPTAAPGGVARAVLLVVAGVAAAWAALVPGRRRAALAPLGLAAGFGLGWASVPDPGPLADRVVTLAGSVLGAFLFTLYLAGAVEWLRLRARATWFGPVSRAGAAALGAVAVVLLTVSFLDPAP